jgi:hypothetical protein
MPEWILDREGATEMHHQRTQRPTKLARAKLRRTFVVRLSTTMCALHVRCNFLPTCNAKALLCMRLCIARASHFYRAKFIPKVGDDRRSIVSQIPAMTPDLF